MSVSEGLRTTSAGECLFTIRASLRGGLRKFYEELHNLYSSSNIFRVIKSRGVRWERHVASNREFINTYRILA
jgi:hypothetical protein